MAKSDDHALGREAESWTRLNDAFLAAYKELPRPDDSRNSSATSDVDSALHAGLRLIECVRATFEALRPTGNVWKTTADTSEKLNELPEALRIAKNSILPLLSDKKAALRYIPPGKWHAFNFDSVFGLVIEVGEFAEERRCRDVQNRWAVESAKDRKSVV